MTYRLRTRPGCILSVSVDAVRRSRAPPAASTLPLRTPAHVEGARPSPSAKRDANSAEPKILGGPFDYAMGVFNFCLRPSVGLRPFEPRADRFLPERFPFVFAVHRGRFCTGRRNG